MRTIQSATKKFATAVTFSTAGPSSPNAAIPAAAPAPPTMNTALRILFAAIMRERCDGAETSWMIA